jgi:LmbE family N-acetylglucosaminyl deacetylase
MTSKIVLFFCLSVLPIGAQQRIWTGTPQLKQSLDKLNVLGSVLMIAAHPDDENTAALAYFARGQHLETAYLSATRGEGGQNLIGSEQGDLLGLIRTQELLAARRIDGAQQFFTRAIDFGFSKTASETLEKWGHDEILSDMVWVIRRYQPDVIILRFSGTSKDGHGHHQSSAILGKEAYLAAADPQRFPEQLGAVKVWKAKRLVWNAFAFNKEEQDKLALVKDKVQFDAGSYNAVLGESYTEIAGISRSQHRSQGMGAEERRGPSLDSFIPVAGEPAKVSLFDGIDTTWNRIEGGRPVGELLGRADHEFAPDAPAKILPLLLDARQKMVALGQPDNPWIHRKLTELDETIAQCAGLFLDANADQFEVAPGGKFKVAVTAINRSPAVIKLTGVTLTGTGAEQTAALSGVLANNKPVTKSLELTMPADQPYSQPFWLTHPPEHNRYVITDRTLIGRPDALPVMTAHFALDVEGTPLVLTRPVMNRYVDRVRGELTRPLEVVPAVVVDLPVPTEVLPGQQTRGVQVRVSANQPAMKGDLALTAGAGWQVTPQSLPFELKNSGDTEELNFSVTPDSPTVAATKLRAIAMVNGRDVAETERAISYEHIPPQVVFAPAVSGLKVAPLRVLAKRVGYVMGAGDEEPAAIRQMGCIVVLLSSDDLASGDLSQYDAIVTGVRAYNVRADLRSAQDRLLEYVKNGGTLIVQYNVAEDPRFRRGKMQSLDHLGPYPLTLSRDRVTVEEAPVEFLSASSPLLHAPNTITSKDFEGWVQERGLYFADKWDPQYQPVIESHDPGEKPMRGGMLYAKYGKGAYIFTAYAWFRQLPAGVPGAYRIFANLLSAGKVQ